MADPAVLLDRVNAEIARRRAVPPPLPIPRPASASPAAPDGDMIDELDRRAAAELERRRDAGFDLGNIGRGIAERAGALGEGFTSAADIVARDAEATRKQLKRQTGLPAIPDPVELAARGVAAFRPDGPVSEWVSEHVGDTRIDPGYEPGTTWEEVKASPAAKAIPFAVEQGLVSVPDMAMALTSLPVYVLARTGELAGARAEADLRKEATIGDLVAALPGAAASALLEWLGARGILGIGDALKSRSLRGVASATGRGSAIEGGTEMGQEGIEHLTSRLGTATGVDAHEMADAMMAGGVAGSIFGGGVRGATATGEALLGRPRPSQDERSPPAGTEPPPGTAAGTGGAPGDVHDGTTSAPGTGRVPLPVDFPKVPVSTTLAKLKAHPRYGTAKAGDGQAADELVAALFKPDRLAAIAARLRPGEAPIVVSAARSEGGNAIPGALARAAAEVLRGEASADIAGAVETHRTSTAMADRLRHPPTFAGPVEAGRQYVVVDDVAATGGTLAELIGHIRRGGGEVVGAVTLASARGGNELALKSETLEALRARHGAGEDAWRATFGHGFEALTQVEAQYLLRMGAKAFAELARAEPQGTPAPVGAQGGGRPAPPTEPVAENIARGRAAVDQVLRTRGSVPGAMVREDVGEITFDWGDPGTPERGYLDGHGFSHIIARRNTEGVDGEGFVRETIPQVLASGSLDKMYGPPNGRRADIVHRGNRVVLSLYRFGARETWVLTGFRDEGGGPGGRQGVNPRPPYARQPSGIQADEGAGPEGRVEPDQSPVNAGPGAAHVGAVEDTANTDTARRSKPIRREDILKPLMKALGASLYEGRVKGRNRLGFFRPRVEEVRVKYRSDLETTAHEIAHLIDHRVFGGFGGPGRLGRPWRKGPKAKTYAQELAGVSYDADKVHEGFAEFVRLWMTQPEQAAAKAPAFHAWWEGFVADSEYGPALKEAREGMLAWQDQNALDRLQSKVGERRPPIREIIAGAADGVRQSVFDDLHGIREMERALTGGLAKVGAYVTARLTRARYSILEGALTLGAPVARADGGHAFEGHSLEAILKPVEGDLDNFLLYAVGRSARELMVQGRENLFTGAEIEAAVGLETPAFRKAFDDYQAWNRAILDFAEAKGVIDPAQRARWRRAQYLPFWRVRTKPGASARRPGEWRGIKALTGGSANIRGVLENVIGNASMLINASLTNETMREVAKLAALQGGARFHGQDSEGRAHRADRPRAGRARHRPRSGGRRTGTAGRGEDDGRPRGRRHGRLRAVRRCPDRRPGATTWWRSWTGASRPTTRSPTRCCCARSRRSTARPGTGSCGC